MATARGARTKPRSKPKPSIKETAKEPVKPKPTKPSLLSRSHLASITQDPRSSRPLVAKDVIRLFDSTFHIVQYVNQAGAYIVPLAGVNREIQGSTITFNAGGRTISAHSVVERVNPIAMGGHSPEYARYVKIVAAIDRGDSGIGGGGPGMVDGGPVAGVGFDTFDSADIPDPGSEAEARVAAGGRTVSAESLIASSRGEDSSMAKKMKSKSAGKNGAAKREKTPKKVRDCVCGCGGETTGYFMPGHDARFHGWIKKLADGRIQRNGKDAKSGEQVVGTSVLNKLNLSAKGDGFKAATPDYYKQD